MVQSFNLVDVISDFELPADHPGVNNPNYRDRRAAIAGISSTWGPGRDAPRVDYTVEEDELWTTAVEALAIRHRTYASRAFVEGAERLGLPTEAVPDLAEVSRRLEQISGFSVGVVPVWSRPVSSTVRWPTGPSCRPSTSATRRCPSTPPSPT